MLRARLRLLPRVTGGLDVNSDRQSFALPRVALAGRSAFGPVDTDRSPIQRGLHHPFDAIRELLETVFDRCKLLLKLDEHLDKHRHKLTQLFPARD